MLRFRPQDTYGSALPAVEGDELDVTISIATTEGLNLLQKLTFFGFIVGAVAVFLKTRKSGIVGEKSLA